MGSLWYVDADRESVRFGFSTTNSRCWYQAVSTFRGFPSQADVRLPGILFQAEAGAFTSFLPVPGRGTGCCTRDTVKVMKVMAAICRHSLPLNGELWPPRHGKVDEVDGGHSVRIFPSREVKFTEVSGCHSGGLDR